MRGLEEGADGESDTVAALMGANVSVAACRAAEDAAAVAELLSRGSEQHVSSSESLEMAARCQAGGRRSCMASKLRSSLRDASMEHTVRQVQLHGIYAVEQPVSY
eukprot:1158237-Pelagomonas_calceolata.AAC.1